MTGIRSFGNPQTRLLARAGDHVIVWRKYYLAGCFCRTGEGTHRAFFWGLSERVREGMRERVLVVGVLLAAALFLTACSSASLTEAEQQSMALVATAPATLQPGDKIRVDVFGEEKLGGEYQLDQAGQVSVPLAGTIKAQGMTNAQLEQALSQKFRTQYLRNPKVTVTIATLAPFYVIGEVQKPGQYDYRSGLNVLTAMAIAGGPTYRASRGNVQIQRRGENKMREYPISSTVPILPGDVIKVPERYF
jgi:polysaccharide biosynthesis/export protein